MSFGLTFSVLCAEDLPFTSREEIVEQARGTFLGPQEALDFLRICSFWPRGAAPSRAPVTSDKPVLLLSGEIDPVTPPRWAEEARKTLPNSVHLVVPGVGHGASAEGCVPQLIAKVLETRKREGARRVVPAAAAAAAVLRQLRGADAMIEVRDLHKQFGSVVAVDDVSFIAADGVVTGLLGPNGAGKTTTLRMLYDAHRARSRRGARSTASR